MRKLVATLMFLVVLSFTDEQVLAVGELDLSFNLTGKVLTSFGHPNPNLYDVAIQPDGKIVAVGDFFNGANYDIAVVRYNTDGSLDTTFDGDGKATTAISAGNDSAKSVAIQPDGKIVVGGSAANSLAFDFALVRYNADGSLDTTFDFDGKLTTPVGFFYSSIRSIAVQNNGKIVAVGDAFGDEKDFAAVRYQNDGRLDSTFGNNGILLTPIIVGFSDSASSVAVQNDGKIVVCGTSSDSLAVNLLTEFRFTVARYNRNGSLDVSFGEAGKIIASFGTTSALADSVALQSDGKILVSGQVNGGGILARYSPNGALDNTFSNDGIKQFSNEHIASPVIQPDGKIIFSRRFGTFPNWTFGITRLAVGGSVDHSFGANGTSLNASGELALQTDGKIVAGTTENGSFAVSRLIGDSPILSNANISGRLANQPVRPVSGGRVTIKNLQTNESKIVFTNPFGYFRASQLATNNFYQITVKHKRYTFTGDAQTIRLLGNINGLVLTADAR